MQAEEFRRNIFVQDFDDDRKLSLCNLFFETFGPIWSKLRLKNGRFLQKKKLEKTSRDSNTFFRVQFYLSGYCFFGFLSMSKISTIPQLLLTHSLFQTLHPPTNFCALWHTLRFSLSLTHTPAQSYNKYTHSHKQNCNTRNSLKATL